MSDCFNYLGKTAARNNARQLRREFDGTKEMFIQIVELEDYPWFRHYYFEPERETMTKGQKSYYRDIEDWWDHERYGEPPELEPFHVVNWNKQMIEELILEGRLDHRLEIMDGKIVQEVYDRTGNPEWIPIAEKLSWDLETKKEIPQNVFDYVSAYLSEEDRKSPKSRYYKRDIGKCLGPEITRKNQFDKLRRSVWSIGDKFYGPGSILVFDIATSKILEFEGGGYGLNDEQLFNILVRPGVFKTFAYHWFGTTDYGHTTDVSEITDLINRAELLVSFNGLRFDEPVLKGIGVEIPEGIYHYDVYDSIRRWTQIPKGLNLNNLTHLNKLPPKLTSSTSGENAEMDCRRTSGLFFYLTGPGLTVKRESRKNKKGELKDYDWKITTSLFEGINKIPTQLSDLQYQMLDILEEYGIRYKLPRQGWHEEV